MQFIEIVDESRMSLMGFGEVKFDMQTRENILKFAEMIGHFTDVKVWERDENGKVKDIIRIEDADFITKLSHKNKIILKQRTLDVDDDDVTEEYIIRVESENYADEIKFDYTSWIPDDIIELFRALVVVFNGSDGPTQRLYTHIICKDSFGRHVEYKSYPRKR